MQYRKNHNGAHFIMICQMPYKEGKRRQEIEQVKNFQPLYALAGKEFLLPERLKNIAKHPEENAV